MIMVECVVCSACQWYMVVVVQCTGYTHTVTDCTVLLSMTLTQVPAKTEPYHWPAIVLRAYAGQGRNKYQTSPLSNFTTLQHQGFALSKEDKVEIK